MISLLATQFSPVITVYVTGRVQDAKGYPRGDPSLSSFHFTHSHIVLTAIIITSANGPGWMIIRGRQVGDMNLISLRGSLGCGSTDSLVIWMMRPTVIAVIVKTKETGNSLTNIWAECCTIYWTDKNLYLQCLRLSRIVAVAQKIFHGWKICCLMVKLNIFIGV